MWKKQDLSECRMVAGARQDGWSISETIDQLGFSRTAIFGFTQNGLEKRKCISGSSVGENAMMSDNKGQTGLR